MNDTTYNGWSNYATWRVNLEVFDGLELSDVIGDVPANQYDISIMLKDYADDVVIGEAGELVADYARAFLADVDWYEIAGHLLDAHLAKG